MIEPEYPSLGKRSDQLEQLVRVTASPDPEELKCAYERIEELTSALKDAQLQLEHLQRCHGYATGAATLARIDEVLS